jgi:hypothetical protein
MLIFQLHEQSHQMKEFKLDPPNRQETLHLLEQEHMQKRTNKRNSSKKSGGLPFEGRALTRCCLLGIRRGLALCKSELFSRRSWLRAELSLQRILHVYA